jgi:hypothetical protein
MAKILRRYYNVAFSSIRGDDVFPLPPSQRKIIQACSTNGHKWPMMKFFSGQLASYYVHLSIFLQTCFRESEYMVKTVSVVGCYFILKLQNTGP